MFCLNTVLFLGKRISELKWQKGFKMEKIRDNCQRSPPNLEDKICIDAMTFLDVLKEKFKRKKMKKATQSVVQKEHVTLRDVIERSRLMYSLGFRLGTVNTAESIIPSTVERLFTKIFVLVSKMQAGDGFIFPEKAPRGQLMTQIETVSNNHRKCVFTRILNKSCPGVINSHHAVNTFIADIIRIVFPYQLFGKWTGPRERLIKNLCLLVGTGYNVTLTISNLCEGIKIEQIEWLTEITNSPKLKKKIFHKLVHWLTSYVISVLRSCFYVTETRQNKTMLVFYRNDRWQNIYNAEIDKLISDGRLVAALEEVPGKRTPIPNCGLRFMPKPDGSFRMINRTLKKPSSQSNKIKTLDDFRYVRALLTKLLKHSEVNQNFKNTLIQLKQNQKKFYYVKVDIKNCYASINTSKLMKIFDEKLKKLYESKTMFSMQDVHIVKISNGKMMVTIKPIAQRDENGDLNVWKSLHKSNSVRIICSKYYSEYSKPQERKRFDPRALLKKYLDDVLIKVGRRRYRLGCGIREGGVLSNHLCAIYMESFLEEHFKFFFHPSCSGAGNYSYPFVNVDDFIFITSDETKAQNVLERFLCKDNVYLEEYNLKLNHGKLRTNVKPSIAYPLELNQFSNSFVFAKVIVDLNRQSVIPDHSSFSGLDIRYSFACDTYKTVEATYKTLLYIFRINPLLLDEHINYPITVVCNIYVLALIQLMRFAAFIRLSPSVSLPSGECPKHVYQFILGLGSKTYRIGKRCSRTVSCPIKFELTIWEVLFVTTKAALLIWDNNAPRSLGHRKKERIALNELCAKLVKNIDKYKIKSWKNNVFSRYSLPFNGIVLPHKM